MLSSSTSFQGQEIGLFKVEDQDLKTSLFKVADCLFCFVFFSSLSTTFVPFHLQWSTRLVTQRAHPCVTCEKDGYEGFIFLNINYYNIFILIYHLTSFLCFSQHIDRFPIVKYAEISRTRQRLLREYSFVSRKTDTSKLIWVNVIILRNDRYFTKLRSIKNEDYRVLHPILYIFRASSGNRLV